jgi:hypothetical protein
MARLDERPLWHLTEPCSAGATSRRSLHSSAASSSPAHVPFDPTSPTSLALDASYLAGPSRSPSPR